MAQAQEKSVKVLESCQVAPPPGSVVDSSLRLTFFDVMWLQLPPVQRLFFYKLSPTHFQNSLLPRLKHSLSQALQLFYPLVGNLARLPDSVLHEIRYAPGDSVSLTVAESESDFLHLSGDHPRDVAELHPLVPHLPLFSGTVPAPVLALQVTHFPNKGICIGISINHAAADGWSSIQFMKSWASIFRSGDPSSIPFLPIYDRSATAQLDYIMYKHFQEMEKVEVGVSESVEAVGAKARDHPKRATFVMGRSNIEGLRRVVHASERGVHVSSFVLTCAYVWTSLLKARGKVDDDDKITHFVFAMDCRVRLVPPLPAPYFGNCVGARFAEAKRVDLKGEDGFVVAAEAIGRAICGLEGDGLLKGAESWIRRFCCMVSEGIVSVAGSPKLGVYETDFGWGKPEKVEIVSIEGTGAISLAESREKEGGIEVGLALPENEMNAFASLFVEGLKPLSP